MHLPDDYKKKIVDEINYVIKEMREQPDLLDKLYFFSGVYGAIYRVFNFHYDPTLIYIHQVLAQTHGALNTRINESLRSINPQIKLVQECIDQLPEVLEELVEVIDVGGDVTAVLQKFAIIAYATTGNGYYLYKKGLLTFF